MPSGILCHLLPNIILPHRIWIQSSGVKAKLKIGLLLLLRSFQVHLENWDRWKPLLKYQIKNRDYLTNLKTNLKSAICSRDSGSVEDFQSSLCMASGEVLVLGILKNGSEKQSSMLINTVIQIGELGTISTCFLPLQIQMKGLNSFRNIR